MEINELSLMISLLILPAFTVLNPYETPFLSAPLTAQRKAAPRRTTTGSGRSSRGDRVLRYTLRKVTDPKMGNVPAYTYLMPKGWRNQDSIEWMGGQQPYPMAALGTLSPDGKFALGVYPGMYGVAYSTPSGRGGTWFRSAEDAVRTLLGKAPSISNFKVLDRQTQRLKSSYGAVAGAQPSADMAVLHCTYTESGVAKEGLVVSRFDNATIVDSYSQSQTWTVSFQVMVAPPGKLMKNATFIRQAATFFYTAYITPAYWKATNKVAMTSAEINRDAALEQGKMIVKSYWDRQKFNDASAENFSDAMRGVERYTSPNGGPLMVLPEGPRYWGSRDGTVIAADDPNYDPNTAGGGTFTPLKRAKG